MKKDKKEFIDYLNSRDDFKDNYEKVVDKTCDIEIDIPKASSFKIIKLLVPALMVLVVTMITIIIVLNDNREVEKPPVKEEIKYEDVYVKNASTNLVLVEVESIKEPLYGLLEDENKRNDKCIIVTARVVKNYFNTTDGEDLYIDSYINIPIELGYIGQDDSIQFYDYNEIKAMLEEASSYLIYLDSINEELVFSSNEEYKTIYFVSNPVKLSKDTIIPIVEDKVSYESMKVLVSSNESEVDSLVAEGEEVKDIDDIIKEAYGEQSNVDGKVIKDLIVKGYIDYIEDGICHLIGDNRLYYVTDSAIENFKGHLIRICYIQVEDKNYIVHFRNQENDVTHTGKIETISSKLVSITNEKGYMTHYDTKYLIDIEYNGEKINLNDITIYSDIEFITAYSGEVDNYICKIKVIKMAEIVTTPREEIAICKKTSDIYLYLKKYKDEELLVEDFYTDWIDVKILDLYGQTITRYEVTATYLLKVKYNEVYNGKNTGYVLTGIEFIGYNDEDYEEFSTIAYFAYLPNNPETNKYINVGNSHTISKVEYSSDDMFVDIDGDKIDKYSLEQNDKLEIVYKVIDRNSKQAIKIILVEKHPVSPAYEDYRTTLLDAITYDGKVSRVAFEKDGKEGTYVVGNEVEVVDLSGNPVQELFYQDEVLVTFSKVYHLGVWELERIEKIILVKSSDMRKLTFTISESTYMTEYVKNGTTFTLPTFNDEEGNPISWIYYDGSEKKTASEDLNVCRNYDFILDYKTNLVFTYEDEVVIKGTRGDDNGPLIIPSYILGKKVVEIESLTSKKVKTKASKIIVGEGIKHVSVNAFTYYRKALEEVIFLGSGEIIFSDRAFSSMEVLKKVDFTDNKVILYNGAFAGCKLLEDIDLTNAIFIGEETFKDCKALKEVYLTNAKTIGHGAFEGCSSLEKAVIGDEIESLSTRMLNGCFKLTFLQIPYLSSLSSSPTSPYRLAQYFGIVYSADESQYYKIYFYDYIRQQGYDCMIPKSLSTIVVTKENYIGKYCYADLSSIKNITYNTEVIMIEKEAFYGCNVKLTFTGDTSLYQKGWDTGVNNN